MATRAIDCPRCGGSMEPGFLLGQARNGFAATKWVAGEPERSFWMGLKLRDKPQLDIATYRCRRCGFLESYAAG